MGDKILCVDDEPSVPNLYQRVLADRFEIDIAQSGAAGLEAITQRGPFAVVVSDMDMPEMDGAQFLAQVRQATPNTVRVLLTGRSDQRSAILAVNQGQIFRFLTKPCSPDAVAQGLSASIEQYRLITAEKELLEKTLRGTVRVLGEVLALSHPAAFERAIRVQQLVQQLVTVLKAENAWQIEVAAMLSQLGTITVPEPVLSKVALGYEVTAQESAMIRQVPATSQKLIEMIPRLEAIVEIITYQEYRFDGEGLPADSRKGLDLPLGSRVLKLAFDWDGFLFQGHSQPMALQELKSRSGWYDPAVVEALRETLKGKIRYKSRVLTAKYLSCDMVINGDVHAVNGVRLVTRGQEITNAMIQRLQNFESNQMLLGGIPVLVPVSVQVDAD